MASPPTSALPNQGVISRVRLHRHSLSPSLQRVADHVVAHADTVIYQTITELASATGVGDATITRLCHKLDFAGFHAFKIALAADVAGRQTSPAPRPGDLLGQAAKIVRQTSCTLEDTAQLLDPNVLERVADALNRAPRVELTGQGNSGLVAQHFAHRLMRLGITASAYTDPHISAVSISTLPRGGVVIAISSSGSTIDTVQHLKLAQSHGQYTVAITHRASSPITRYASAVLFSSTQEEPLTDAVFDTLASQALVLEVLFAALLSLRPHAAAMLRVTAESVVEKKY